MAGTKRYRVMTADAADHEVNEALASCFDREEAEKLVELYEARGFGDLRVVEGFTEKDNRY